LLKIGQSLHTETMSPFLVVSNIFIVLRTMIYGEMVK